ncbi:hypothetical protein AVEN_272019-1, partial [Araneus ventricosus]
VGACLFENSYYVSLKKALKPGGILVSQGIVNCFVKPAA